MIHCLKTIKTQTRNNQVTELDMRMRSSVERALGNFLWDQRPKNVTIRRPQKKMILLVTLISGPKTWLHDQ